MNRNCKLGDQGEDDVIKKVPCPNCGMRLVRLPKNFPLYDVQCEGCVFRAQVKTNRSPPKDQVFGSGREILRHFKAGGQLIPPLIANFCWSKGSKPQQKIIFYPFLTKDNIKGRVRSKRASHPGYKEFNYVGLLDEETPKVVVYPKRRAA